MAYVPPLITLQQVDLKSTKCVHAVLLQQHRYHVSSATDSGKNNHDIHLSFYIYTIMAFFQPTCNIYYFCHFTSTVYISFLSISSFPHGRLAQGVVSCKSCIVRSGRKLPPSVHLLSVLLGDHNTGGPLSSPSTPTSSLVLFASFILLIMFLLFFPLTSLLVSHSLSPLSR